jgi:hypothetical protein
MRFIQWIRNLVGRGLEATANVLRGIADFIAPRPPSESIQPPEPPMLPSPLEPTVPGEPVPPLAPPETGRRPPDVLAPPVRPPGPVSTLPPGSVPPTYWAGGLAPPKGELLGRFRYEVIIPYTSRDRSYSEAFRLVVWSDRELTWGELRDRALDRIQLIYFQYGRKFGGYEYSDLIFSEFVSVQGLAFW